MDAPAVFSASGLENKPRGHPCQVCRNTEMHNRWVFLQTYGCQMNERDSEET